ncbi:hypothetical protein Q1695_014096 [Nippostrongylus brasiliensis]|nr:hypothetical protein Q1695_014096 [Nippostrongylus brasiliensis]
MNPCRELMKCLLCGAATKSKPQLIQHLCQHLAYKKYPCTTCTELFYTEEEREIHCRKKAHVHTYEVNSSPYCELYLNQLLKDFEHVELYGLEAVILQRSKSNLTCDVAINKKTPRVVTNRKGDVTTTPDHELTRESLSEASPSCSYKKTTKDNAQSSANRERKLTDDWTRIEVDKTPDLSTATQLLADTLRTKISEHCRLCHKSTSSDYVERKHHVSSAHLPKDHTESDYVEILSEMMKKAYPGLPYNDLQCQMGQCQKELRRFHVIRFHFPYHLKCPLDCSFQSNDCNQVNNHLKDSHNLVRGYLSIVDEQQKRQFVEQKHLFNQRLANVIDRAFPCPIPECAKPGFKNSDAPNSVQEMITKFGDSSRKFQRAPPNPLRLRSPSSDSDSDSTTQYKVIRTKQKKPLSSLLEKVVSPPAPEEVVLDDDEGEDKHVPEVSPKNSPQKQPQVRKLAISGVCIKAPRMRASPERSVKSEPPKGGRRQQSRGFENELGRNLKRMNADTRRNLY